MLKIDVHATRAVLRAQEPLTVGLVGALVHFVFDDLWKNLSRIAVFRQGNVIKDAVVTGDFVAIPREVLQQPWLPLEIGVYGTDARGKRVIPTVWVRTDPVQPAAEPVDDPGLEPTAAVWQQVLGSMGNLDALDTENRTDLVSAINEANRAVCLVTVTAQGDRTYSADPGTYRQIMDAHEAGRTVLCKCGDLLLPLTSAVSTCVFGSIDNAGVYCQVTIASTDEVTVSTRELEAGGLHITDDGNGNVTITSSGAVTITDDGEGNVTIT